jgi:hypothetical protein
MKGEFFVGRQMYQTELPLSGFEPGTFSFKVQRSTTELKRHVPLAELVGMRLSFVTGTIYELILAQNGQESDGILLFSQAL